MDRNQKCFLPFCTCSFAQKMANGRLLFLRERGGGNGSKNGGRSHEEEKKRKEG